ncbi:MAG: potassium transporter Kup [Planctomyces sp.]|nr:potassium transporter Kup [Planctomyces sp.]
MSENAPSTPSAVTKPSGASPQTPAHSPSASAAPATSAHGGGSETGHQPGKGGPLHLAWLSLAALGVVYGDIGTSPLYALRECFHGAHGIAVTPDNVMGVLSLVFWALIVVISIKYLIFILQADNRGEGGILALMALATPIKFVSSNERWWLVVLGLFGAALLYGDGMITPAISVLGAIEGLNVATHVFEPFVVPITVAILVGLFAIQSHGTAGIGKLFGPVMIVWFTTLAVLGIANLISHPAVVASFNPLYGARFLLANGWHGFLVLGSVFLVVTGGEALYADMGHFGRRPIRIAWFALVFPSLILNYLGQGALLITNPAAAANPFYFLAPSWGLYPLVALATMAAVIASQALISGAYSITMQASQLGFLPRLQIRHTSATEYGQIYMPAINTLLMIGCVLTVIGFRSSNALAAAYGIAVTSTMAITTVIFYIVARERWHWSRPVAGSIAGVFLLIDLAFFGANVTKIPDGGWLPIVVAIVIFTIMTTWKRGRQILAARLFERAYPIDSFLKDISLRAPVRVPGTAVFMSGSGQGTPPALMQNIEHNKVLHEQVVLLTVKTEQTPHVDDAERVSIETLAPGIFRVMLTYGFMEDPDIPRAMMLIRDGGFTFDPGRTTYFLGRESLLASAKRGGMAAWRERLFATMSHNATSATRYFCLPPDRVIELGSQLEI